MNSDDCTIAVHWRQIWQHIQLCRVSNDRLNMVHYANLQPSPGSRKIVQGINNLIFHDKILNSIFKLSGPWPILRRCMHIYYISDRDVIMTCLLNMISTWKIHFAHHILKFKLRYPLWIMQVVPWRMHASVKLLSLLIMSVMLMVGLCWVSNKCHLFWVSHGVKYQK